MRSELIKREVFRYLDRQRNTEGVVPRIINEFGIHEAYALDLYNEWAQSHTALPIESAAPERIPGLAKAIEHFQRGPLEGEIADLQRRIVAWADKTFPDRTLHECFNKLALDELPEVFKKPTDPAEYADLIVLVLDMAVLAVREHNARCDAAGMDDYLDPIDVLKAVNDKMTVNEGRVWLTDPQTGLRQHTKELS